MSGRNGFDLQSMVSGVIKTAQAKLAEEDKKCGDCGASLEDGECPKCEESSAQRDTPAPAVEEAAKTAAALDYLAAAVSQGHLVADEGLSIEKIAQAYQIVYEVESDPQLAFRVKRALAEGIGPNDGGEVVPNDLNSPPGGGGSQQRAVAKAPAKLLIPQVARTAAGIGPNSGGEAIATDVNDVPGGGGAYPAEGVIRKAAEYGGGGVRTTRKPIYELSNQELKRRHGHEKGEAMFRAGKAGLKGGLLGSALGTSTGVAMGSGRAAAGLGALGAVGGTALSGAASLANTGMKRWDNSREMKRRGMINKKAEYGGGSVRTTRKPLYELSDAELKRRHAHEKGELGFRSARAAALTGGPIGALAGATGAAMGSQIGKAILQEMGGVAPRFGKLKGGLAGAALGVGAAGLAGGMSAASTGMKRWDNSREMKRRGLKKTATSRIVGMAHVMRKLSEEQPALGGGTVGAASAGENIPQEGQPSFLASNQAAIAYSKADAKKMPVVVSDLGKVLSHPAMSSAHDDVLSKNLSHTEVAKLAAIDVGRPFRAIHSGAQSLGRNIHELGTSGGRASRRLRRDGGATDHYSKRVRPLREKAEAPGASARAIKKHTKANERYDKTLESAKGYTAPSDRTQAALGYGAGAVGVGGVGGATALGVSSHKRKREKQAEVAAIARRELMGRVLEGDLDPGHLNKLASVENRQRREIDFKQSLQEAARSKGESMNGLGMPIEMPGSGGPSPSTSGY